MSLLGRVWGSVRLAVYELRRELPEFVLLTAAATVYAVVVGFSDLDEFVGNFLFAPLLFYFPGLIGGAVADLLVLTEPRGFVLATAVGAGFGCWFAAVHGWVHGVAAFWGVVTLYLAVWRDRVVGRVGWRRAGRRVTVLPLLGAAGRILGPASVLGGPAVTLAVNAAVLLGVAVAYLRAARRVAILLFVRLL